MNDILSAEQWADAFEAALADPPQPLFEGLLRTHDAAQRARLVAAERRADDYQEERDAEKARRRRADKAIADRDERVAALEAGLRDAVWQFNEAVSMLREARGYLLPTTGLAEEIDEGIDAMQAALEAAASLGGVPATKEEQT